MEDMKIKWTLYIAFTSLFLFISVSEVGPLSFVRTRFISRTQSEPVEKFVIVFDGGSTATRIHVFSFYTNSEGYFSLKNEYFEAITPALSTYANNPSNAANNVLYLLEKAKSLIPTDRWTETPVALKATAGLRLLPNDVSNSILEKVFEVFKTSPFRCDDNCVTVLSGDDEGLFGWYTINFLLGRIHDANRSVVTLDLGGGSTQITFTPVDFETFLYSPKSNILLTNVQNKSITIYTHSYLGLGLMSARHSILQISTDKTDVIENNTQVFSSSCISPNDKITWEHNLKEYVVTGRKSGKYGFKHCYNKAVKFLGNTVHRPEELNKREIYVNSYYFDRALDLGIIGKEGGARSVDDYYEACREYCSEKNSREIFLCLDCSYITALLHHGFGFHGKKVLKFVKQINGIETSWALGAALNML